MFSIVKFSTEHLYINEMVDVTDAGNVVGDVTYVGHHGLSVVLCLTAHVVNIQVVRY